MKFKREIIFTLLTFMLVLPVAGQLQSGYVRTAGRPDKIEGKRLPGAAIRFRGVHNAVVSDRKGVFSIQFGGSETSYIINSVVCDGYELQEKELLGRREPVSESVPKEIVMVSLKEKKKIEDKVRRQVESKYQSKLEALQKELDEHKISEEQYTAEMKRLNDEYEIRDRLIHDMVERYAYSDYAKMNAKEIEINTYIENGELEKADSVINSLNISKLEADRSALMKDINIKERQLEAERLSVRSIDSTLWMAYRAKADIFFADFQNDSVLYYLEKMLTLDPTNVALMIEIGSNYDYYMADKVRSLYYLNRAREMQGDDSTSTYLTICMNDIGTCYYDYGILDSAKIYLEKALRLAQLQGDKAREALALSNLTLYYDMVHDRENQKRCIEQAMEIYVALYGPKNEHMITQFNHLGAFYHDLHDYRKAIDCHKKALKVMPIKKDVYDHVWSCYNNLGNEYHCLGMLDSAEYWHIKALAMVKEVYAENHPNVATVLGNISSLYSTRGKYREAIKLRKRALAINTAYFKDYHRDIARDMVNLSTLYGYTKQEDSTLYYTLEALRIYEAIDSASPDLITVYSNIGSYYTTMGELNTALDYFIKGDNIVQMNPGENKNGAASLYTAIGDLFNKAGMYEKAVAYYDESLKMLEEIYNSDNNNFIVLLNNMGIAYSHIGNKEKAFELHRRVNHILDKEGLDNTMDAAVHYQTFATELFEAGITDSVEYLLRKAYRIIKREVGDTSIDAIDTHSNLTEYYFATANYDSALVYALKQYEIFYRRQMVDDYDFYGVCLMIHTILHRLGRTEERERFMEDKAFVLDVNPEGPMASRGYEGRYYLLEWKSWDFADTAEFYNAHIANVPTIKTVVYRDGKVYTESFEGKAGVMVHMALVGREKRKEIVNAYNNRK